MKIQISYGCKTYSAEFKENITVMELLNMIRQKNKIKKNKTIIFCNDEKHFEDSDILGEFHDSENFFIIDQIEFKKHKSKKLKKEDLAEIIQKCTNSKSKLENR